MNLLVYNARLRLMRKREEHHRAANDADDPPKHEQLWGQGAKHLFSCLQPANTQLYSQQFSFVFFLARRKAHCVSAQRALKELWLAQGY